MKLLRFLLLAALVAMPLTACDDDNGNGTQAVVGTVTGTVTAEGDGLSGVSVTLSGATSQSATTGSGGTYTFTNVESGSYSVSIDASSAPDVSFSQTAKTTSITTDGQTQTVDFAGQYIRTASIVGSVTASGAPLASVAVTVSGGPDGTPKSDVTNAGGEYAVTGLRAGTYTVTISDVPTGVSFTSLSKSVTVNTGETKTAVFAGTAEQLATISGAVTVDNVGTAGIAVALSGGATASTETGPNGAFMFTNLSPGSYTVTVTPPPDVTFTATSKDVTVNAGETAVVNFAGATPAEPATISIQSITPGGVPVNLSQCCGQIEVALNITRGDRTCRGSTSSSVTSSLRPRRSPLRPLRALKQAAGDQDVVTLNVPTTQLRMGSTTYVPVVFNGGANISANLWEVDAAAPIPTNDVPVVMSNADALLTSDGALIPGVVTRYEAGLAADVVTGAGLSWNTGGLEYDGPIHISYSTTKQIPTWESGLCGDGDGASAGTYDTGLIVSSTWDCAGIEGQNIGPGTALPVAWDGPGVGPDGTPVILPVYDDECGGEGNPCDSWSSLGAEFQLGGEARWYILTPTPLSLEDPDEFDVDNLGPTVTMLPVAFNQDWDEWWINEDYSLIDGLIPPDADGYNRDDDPIQLADGGSGPDWDSREARDPGTLIEDDPDYWSCEVVVTNADLAPTNTSDWAVDGHNICGFGKDLVGNEPSNEWLPLLPSHDGVTGFGKDILAPIVTIIGDSPGNPGVTACTAPYPGLAEGMNDTDNLFNIANPFPAGIGFGVDAIDDRAGFHQLDEAQAPPVDQTITRYYPDAGSTGTESTETFGDGWLKEVLANNYVRSSDFAGAEGCMDVLSGSFDPDNAGLYVWAVTVTDMAGNMTSLSQDWATDQVNIPVFSAMVLGALQYNAGQPGLFLMYGSDDFEVDQVQVSMTYPTDVAHDGGAPD